MLSNPRGVDIDHQTPELQKHIRIALKEKRRLCGLATETVLLLAEVTLDLALLDELEVLLCKIKDRLAHDHIPKVVRFQ